MSLKHKTLLESKFPKCLCHYILIASVTLAVYLATARKVNNNNSSTSSSNMSKWPKVLLIGDSLTQFGFSAEGGWAAMLANALQRRCDVVNRGFSGYTTRYAFEFMRCAALAQR